ncbi:MAG: hypothetical protein HY332_23170 [Chloroflexi bacterium]|nr:hypothetical protein [Chloroflexota bacterium]
MTFTTRLSQQIFRTLATLSPDERRRLYRCWQQLAADPYVDHLTKHPFPLPPLVLSRQTCGGFVTVYGVRGDEVTLFNVKRLGVPPAPPTRRPEPPDIA